MSTRQIPIRPSLPAAVWVAAAMWAGVIAAEGVMWWSPGRASVFAALLIAVLTGAAVAWRVARQGAIALVCVGLATGLVLGGLCWMHWDARVDALRERRGTRWEGEVISDVRIGRFGGKSDVRVNSGDVVSVAWPSGEDTPAAGQSVEFFGEYVAPVRDEWGRRDHRSGKVGAIRARVVHVRGPAHSLRGVILPLRSVGLRALRVIPGAAGALLDGVVLGERTRLVGTQAEADFKTTGLTHLVAVSGGHLVVVAVCLQWLCRRMRVRRVWEAAIVTACLAAYVVASGAQPSAVRAWVMAAILVALGLGGRRGDGIGALAATAVVVVAASPAAVFDLGMQLSLAAVAGLILFGRFVECWLTEGFSRRIGVVLKPVGLTLVAQAATLPLTIGVFGMVSLVAPVANVLASPLISVALGAGLLGVLLCGVPVVGRGALYVAALASEGCVRLAGWLAGWPSAAIPLGVNATLVAVCCLGAAIAAWVSWPPPNRRWSRGAVVTCLVGTLALGAGPVPAGGPQLTVLDVGQGDAILVRDGRSAVLVDAGPDANALREASARMGLRRLDGVIVTHLHDDHMGGLNGLDGVVSVGGLWATEGAAPKRVPARLPQGVDVLRAGQVIRIGSVTVRVLWPRSPPTDPSANESSIVCLVECAGTSVLLTGDAEAVVLDQLAEDGALADVDVIKVGHHGSAGAVSERALAVLRPEVAIISVGAGNRFGHPMPSTLDQLTSSGSQVLRTDLLGDITVRFGQHGWTISTSKRGIAGRRCATLAVAQHTPRSLEFREYDCIRLEARVSHHQRATAVDRPSPRASQEARWRGG